MNFRERLESIQGTRIKAVDRTAARAAGPINGAPSLASRLQRLVLPTPAFGHPSEEGMETARAVAESRTMEGSCTVADSRAIQVPSCRVVAAERSEADGVGNPRWPKNHPTSNALSPRQLARQLGGELCADGVVLVEEVVPLSHSHGRARFDAISTVSLQYLAGGEEPQRAGLLFIDTETSGLSGGTGTVAFVLGLARIENDSIAVRQYFLTSFRGESAMLAHALDWINAATHLVSYNGKCFDIPLLTTRYRLARTRNPFGHLAHIDLLHPTRTAYATNLPDCRLQTAEQYLFKLFRDDDLPGHLIPQIWTSFMRQGDTRGLRAIIEHNRLDILSLVALVSTLARTYAQPGHDYVDAVAVARAHKRRGDQGSALHHLEEPAATLNDQGQLELASLYARGQRWEKAIVIWETLAQRHSSVALERLAMYFEHVARDFGTALRYAQILIAVEHSPTRERRIARLQQRLSRRLQPRM